MIQHLKQIIRRYTSKYKIYYNLMLDIYIYSKKLLRHNASIKTDEDIMKMQYTLLRENHVIGKGMSMRNPRKGFGQEKVAKLIDRLERYYTRYGNIDKEFLIYPLSTIKQYISYTKINGTKIPLIEEKYHILLRLTSIEEEQLVKSSGIVQTSKNEIIQASQLSFEKLLNSRHSIRYFTKNIPSREDINKALRMAQKTPSACNRQGWHTHIFMHQDCTNLLRQQGGANGFEDEIRCCILVTADMRAFLSYEPMQCYVDGGLYAMNLINSLHSLGYGTIPLSCGFTQHKLDIIAKNFNIPNHEVMICIIGVGCMPEHFNIAVSHRKDIECTNTYH